MSRAQLEKQNERSIFFCLPDEKLNTECVPNNIEKTVMQQSRIHVIAERNKNKYK